MSANCNNRTSTFVILISNGPVESRMLCHLFLLKAKCRKWTHSYPAKSFVEQGIHKPTLSAPCCMSPNKAINHINVYILGCTKAIMRVLPSEWIIFMKRQRESGELKRRQIRQTSETSPSSFQLSWIVSAWTHFTSQLAPTLVMAFHIPLKASLTSETTLGRTTWLPSLQRYLFMNSSHQH